MADIKPIETVYKGYRFRSRLEARWAVFFDELNIEYEYEKEGYNLNGIYYLPDFFLPKIRKGTWVEIKPNYCLEKSPPIGQLSITTGFDSMVVKGDPFDMVMGDMPGYDDGSAYWINSPFKIDDGSINVGEDGPYIFCICPWCGKPGLEFDGRGGRVCGYKTHYKDEKTAGSVIGEGNLDKCYTGNHPRLINAAKYARQARFEHGEKP